jgi:hypothetical protein
MSSWKNKTALTLKSKHPSAAFFRQTPTLLDFMTIAMIVKKSVVARHFVSNVDGTQCDCLIAHFVRGAMDHCYTRWISQVFEREDSSSGKIWKNQLLTEVGIRITRMIHEAIPAINLPLALASNFGT